MIFSGCCGKSSTAQHFVIVVVDVDKSAFIFF